MVNPLVNVRELCGAGALLVNLTQQMFKQKAGLRRLSQER
jgi:hypothetical protein